MPLHLCQEILLVNRFLKGLRGRWYTLAVWAKKLTFTNTILLILTLNVASRRCVSS